MEIKTEYFENARNLIGESLCLEDLKHIDCYCTQNLGIFIPISGQCGYAKKENHIHPSYMVTVIFDKAAERLNHFSAQIFSPEIPHNDFKTLHYYAICIDRTFFESCYKMYSPELPVFKGLDFEMCSDVLKYMNMFAFEASKAMMNSQETLEAHAKLMTHWIIRSLLGESMDMRAISNDYSVARAQHFMEQHFGEEITIEKLSKLGYVSASSLTRKFKTELGISPIEYLIEIRIQKAKNMLIRKSLSVTQIAQVCGFSSSAHFSSCFQKRVGVSPKEYQEKFR